MNNLLKANINYFFVAIFLAYSILFGTFSNGDFIIGTILLTLFTIILFFVLKRIDVKINSKKEKEINSNYLSVILFILIIILLPYTIIKFNMVLAMDPSPDIPLTEYNAISLLITFMAFLLVSSIPLKSRKLEVKSKMAFFFKSLLFYSRLILLVIIGYFIFISVYIILTF